MSVSHELASVIREFLGLLETTSLALDGDEVDERKEKELFEDLDNYRVKLKKLSERIAQPVQPAQATSLQYLKKLRLEVEAKNQKLETLQLGLKEFELEMSLRSGTARKEEKEAIKMAEQVDPFSKRFHFNE